MQNLIGARILIVEPDILLAVHLSIEFEQLGTSSSVITPTLARAREAAAQPGWSAAVVDCHQGNCDLTPAIEPLINARVPVIMTSHWPREVLPERLGACSFARKPYLVASLVQGVSAAINGATFISHQPARHI